MIATLVWLINLLVQLVTLLVIIQVVLSYFMSPFHPLRQTVDRLVEPLLRPIRRILPTMGMLDFSPFVLLLLIQLGGRILTTILIGASK